MTTELTNRTTQQESKTVETFFDISLRQEGESMFTRADRVMTYFESLPKNQQIRLKKQYDSIVEYFKEVRDLNKFKRQNA